MPAGLMSKRGSVGGGLRLKSTIMLLSQSATDSCGNVMLSGKRFSVIVMSPSVAVVASEQVKVESEADLDGGWPLLL